ncbi:MAG: sugar phosphate nucleotidyltransferase [Nitrosopumilus sp.]
MKAIVPVGGLGSRFDNNTFDRPKCLLPVLENKLVIDYVLENLKSIHVDEVIMILGYRGEQIRDYVLKNYDFNFTFVQQTKRFGELGYAMLLGFSEIREYKKGNTECIVVLGDTILDDSLEFIVNLGQYKSSNVLAFTPVDNPERFHVCVIAESRSDTGHIITELHEKPSEFKSENALIGIYYFLDINSITRALKIHYRIVDDCRSYIPLSFCTAMTRLLDHGEKFIGWQAFNWHDCGLPTTLEKTSRYFLDKQNKKECSNE